MTSRANFIIDAIGKNPLVELKNIVPASSARIIAKLESANPTGSMKDRMAIAVIKGTEKKDLLKQEAQLLNIRRVQQASHWPLSALP